MSRRRFARKRTRSETPNNLTSSVDPNARRSGLIEGTHKIRLSPSDTVRAAKQKISVRRSRVRVRSRISLPTKTNLPHPPVTL